MRNEYFFKALIEITGNDLDPETKLKVYGHFVAIQKINQENLSDKVYWREIEYLITLGNEIASAIYKMYQADL